MTPEETAELERLLAEATPGPWFKSYARNADYELRQEARPLSILAEYVKHDDAALIVFFRNHAAALLAAARQAEAKDARIAELEAALEQRFQEGWDEGYECARENCRED